MKKKTSKAKKRKPIVVWCVVADYGPTANVYVDYKEAQKAARYYNNLWAHVGGTYRVVKFVEAAK